MSDKRKKHSEESKPKAVEHFNSEKNHLSNLPMNWVMMTPPESGP
jgi:hypothetical protein